ncbi:MAG TPA: TetR family transcriptional regulator [Acidimicrobiales bacterium]|jgi:AcrR family transcriptional regulator|nr:TetR family transcriptional regulator [Acidimicrobiales bacterium]
MGAAVKRRRVGRPPGPAPDPAARREELLAAAERAIRANGPDIGMGDIAAEIGLTKPAVYRSLGDKAQLSAALAGRIADRLADQLTAAVGGGGEIRPAVTAAIDVFCGFVDEDTNLYRFVVHGSVGTPHTGLPSRPLVARLGRLISGQLAGVLEPAGAAPGLADTWAYAILGGVFAATERWRRHRHVSRAELVEQLAAFIVPALESAVAAPRPSGPERAQR